MPDSPRSPSRLGTLRTFLRLGACSTTLCHVVDRAYDDPLDPEERAAGPLAGGVMGLGHQCGQVWGAALAAGARAFRILGPGPRAEAAAVIAAQRIVASFRARYGSADCRDIIEADLSDRRQVLRSLLKHGPRCLFIAAGFAPVALGEVEAAFDGIAGRLGAAPPPPVSCAAMVARGRGASDLQTAMAAGFAGGIGLSGGACGALAAAIWLSTLNEPPQGPRKVMLQSPALTDLLDRFESRTGSKLRCADIVGRRFTGIDDHAAFLRDGGCADLIALLTARKATP